AVEVAPEVEVAEGGVALDGGLVGVVGELLEVRLADEEGAPAVAPERVADGRHVLGELGAQGPGAVVGRVEPGDERGAGGRAGGVGAVGAVEAGALAAEAVKRGGLDPGVDDAEGAV